MASSAAESNPDQARRLGLASLEFSIAGIVVTLVIVVIVVAVVANRRHDEGICSSYGCVFWDDKWKTEKYEHLIMQEHEQNKYNIPFTHGRRSRRDRGDKSLQNLERGTLMQIVPPDFVI